MSSSIETSTVESVAPSSGAPFSRSSAALIAAALIWPMAALAVGAPAIVGSLQVGLLVGVLSAAAWSDCREGLIRNSLVAPAMGLAVALALAADAVRLWEYVSGESPDSAANSAALLTTVGLGDALLGGVVCAIVPLASFLAGSGGGGDVKLAFVVGLLLGSWMGVVAVAATYLAAGLVAVIWLVCSSRLWRLIAASLRLIVSRLWPAYVVEPSEKEREVLSVALPMAPFYAVGVCVALYERSVA